MKNLFLLIMLSISITACRKDDDQNTTELPKATQSGANTGGAIVDGKIWVALIEPPIIGNGSSGTYYQSVNGKYQLQINLRGVEDRNGNFIVIKITSNQDINVGDYVINDIEENKGIYSIALKGYITNPNNTGVLSITKFDKENKIVSGTFSFKAQYQDSSVTITDGRFDKKYYLN